MAYPVNPCETIVRPIEGYENYTIDIYGNVTNITTGKVKKHWIGSDGYYRVDLYKNKKKKHFGVHRLLAQTFLKNHENKPLVDHVDMNKLNNDLTNLRFATKSENSTNVKIRKDNKLKIRGICINKKSYVCRAVINEKVYRKYIPIKNENSLNLAKFQIVLYDILRLEYAARV